MITLNVEKRPKMTPDALRKAGKIPAVFYGPKEKSTPIAILLSEFTKVWKKAGESSVIILKEGNNEHEALIHELDVHPVNGTPQHADFYVIEKGKKVEVSIPLIFSGVSSAVKDKGGILVKVMHDLEIEAAPKDLPQNLTIDISVLTELNSVIKASDIKLPAGVTLKVSGDDIVASIAEAKEEVEEVKPIDMAAIEVEKKGKVEVEGEAGEAPAKDAKDSKDAK